MSNAYAGGIGFCKEEAKTFAQLLLHWDHGMNNGRQIKSFLWRHKFPLGCGSHVSKFPIQSLYYPCFDLWAKKRELSSISIEELCKRKITSTCHSSTFQRHLLNNLHWNFRGRPFNSWGGVGDFWSASFFFLAIWWAGNFFPSWMLCRIFFSLLTSPQDFFSSKKCRVCIYIVVIAVIVLIWSCKALKCCKLYKIIFV